MRIGIDASRAATAQRTGTEAYALYLIGALLPLARAAGHAVTLYFNAPDPDWRSPFAAGDGAVVRNLPQRRLWTHIRLARALAKDRPDVFFTPAHVIPYSYRGSAVATIHDLGYRYFPQAHPLLQRLYLGWSTGHNARRSRLVIADSAATRQDLALFYGVDETRVQVVHPGPPPGIERVADPAQVATVVRRYGIRGPYLLYLGTLQPRKNLLRLVRSFSTSQLAGQFQLVLAGKRGWLARPLEAAIATLPERDARQILLPGFIADEDKATVISGATALLFPSLYEGFGFPLLEAQACDTAVLAASASSLPELAADSALLVDPLDEQAMSAGVARLAKDAALRRMLIQRGRANVKRFDWRKTAEQVLDTLERAALAPA